MPAPRRSAVVVVMSLADQFWQHVDPNNPRLLGKVDFLGLIGTLGRAGFLGLVAGLVAIPLAVAGAFEEIVQAVGFGFLVAPAQGFVQWLTVLQSIALNAAAGDLPAFEVFALPASAVSALGPVLVLAFVIALAWGFEE